MSARAAALAERFREAHDAVLAMAAGCTETQWQTVCVGERWTVGAVVRHIAWGYEPELACLPAFLEGAAWPAIFTSEGLLDATNAAQGAAWATADRAETLALLRHNGELVARAIARLTDAQLARSSQPPWNTRPWTTAEWVEWVLVGHTLEHLDSIRATLGANVT